MNPAVAAVVRQAAANAPASPLAARKALSKMRSSGALLAANLLEAILPFVRNIALARLITREQFGLAVTLSVVIGIVEVVTDFGLPVFAVSRTTQGSASDTMGTLQSLAVVRSAVIGALLVAISPWVAAAFGAPRAIGIYALLGPVALLRGFQNFGTKELMRDYVFWREAIVVVGVQIIWTIVTILVAAVTHRFECMIWGMIAGVIAEVALTHVLSPRPYRLCWNGAAAKEAARFGRPLLVNGMAVSLNISDRFLVGTMLGPSLLALYSVAYGTAMLPRTVLSKFLNSVFVPLFVEHRERASDRSNLFDSWAWCLSALGFCLALGLGLLGGELLGLVFGVAYKPSRNFMCLAGMSMFVKFLMSLPVPPAYASGDTRVVMHGSLLSALSMLPGAAILLYSHNLELFLLAMVAAEFVALLFFTRSAIVGQTFTPSATWLVIAVPFLLLVSLQGIALVAPRLPFPTWIGVCAVVLALGVAFYAGVAQKSHLAWRRIVA